MSGGSSAEGRRALRLRRAMRRMAGPGRSRLIDKRVEDFHGRHDDRHSRCRGRRVQGYLTVPEAGSGPGLLIEQETLGINASLREVADLYAEEGYVCLVPDPFWRMEPGVDLGYDEADFAKAFGFYQRFDVDQALVDIGAALEGLRARPECTG